MGVNKQKHKSRIQLIIVLVFITVCLLLFFFIKDQKNPLTTSDNSNTTKSVNSSSNQDTSNLQVVCSEKYLCKIILKDSDGHELKQREINLSQLGWDVGLIYEYSHGGKLAFYDPSSDKIILPLTVAPGGIGGSKPEGTLPDPPFKTAIYITKFPSNSPLTQLYSNTVDDFIAHNSVFIPSTNQLLLTEVIPSETDSREIIWSFKLNGNTLEKFAEISLQPLSPYGSNFMDLQLSGDKIIQLVEPNGGTTSSKAKLVSIDINTKDIKIEDRPWR